MKTTAQRKRERARERKERLFGPPGYWDWLTSKPCRKCGQSHLVGGHHDPPEGMSKRGHWTKTVPLCRSCHTGAPDSRHRHKGGAAGFWSDLGTTPEEATEQTMQAWESEGDAA